MDICCGYYHSILIDIEGTCWVFGKNDYYQLGLGDRKNRTIPTKIDNLPIIRLAEAGYKHTILIDIDDIVYSFGSNEYFQLGFIDRNDHRSLPTQIVGFSKILSAYCGCNHTFLVDINNKIWGFGINDCGQLGIGKFYQQIPTKLPFDDEIYSIVCFVNSNIIINTRGQCFIFGYNGFGQLGLGHINNVCVPTKVKNLIALTAQPGRYYKTKSARNKS